MPTDKKQMVREIIDIIRKCQTGDTRFATDMEVCIYLKEEYGLDAAEATQLLIGAELIDELALM